MCRSPVDEAWRRGVLFLRRQQIRHTGNGAFTRDRDRIRTSYVWLRSRKSLIHLHKLSTDFAR
jgi:hypothetical protein